MEPVHVVFVHGLFSKPSVWSKFQRLVANDPELTSFVTTACFRYDSPRLRYRPDRRIPEIEDIADQLGTYLAIEKPEVKSLVLVTHSQGGIIAQRLLIRTLQRDGGMELARIKQVVMYASPNRGSEFFLTVRRFAWLIKNPQERQLRPFNRALSETEQAIMRCVVNATERNESKWHIPIAAYGGATDGIVPTLVARGNFQIHGVVDGDHFSIIQPADAEAKSYKVLKHALIALSADSANQPASSGDMRPVEAGMTVGEISKPVSVAPPYGQRITPLQGRDALLNSITSETSPVHVLAGLGGSGKSRLALEIANRERSRRRVWWIPTSRINSGLREVASQLGAPENEVSRSWREMTSAADLLWHQLNASTSPWLLIIDNVDTPSKLAQPHGHVSDGTGWLREPVTPHGMVIVTSLNRNENEWGNWCKVHLVNPLDDQDGAAVLMGRAGREAGTYEQARALSATLGGLPLALCGAADYLKSVASTKIFPGEGVIRDFDGFRRSVKSRFESPAGERTTDLAELGRVTRSVLEIPLELLARRGLHEAAPLLKLFSCLSIAPIPYHALLASPVLNESSLCNGLSPARRYSVLRALHDLGLIESFQQPGGGDVAHVLTMHPVVQGLLRADDDVQRRRSEYYGLNVRLMLSVTTDADGDEPANWTLWNAIAPHAVELCRASLLGATRLTDSGVILQCLELVRLTIRYLIATGLLAPADELVRSIITNCSVHGFAERDRPILGLRHEQARIELERGNPKVAEAAFRQIVAERTTLLGEHDADTLASRHKYAKAIMEQGRWAEAEPLLRAIVLAEHEVRGAEHKDTLVVRHSHARSVLALGRTGEAEVMLREILEVHRRRSPVTSPEAFFVRSSLGRCLTEQDRPAEAETEMLDALGQAGPRPTTPSGFWIRHVLANAVLLQGRPEEARELLTDLAEDQRRVLGVTHPDTVRTANVLKKLAPG